MQYEGESSVVQVIFTEKGMICVVHPSSVLPEFSSSKNQQSLMSVSLWAWFWVCFQVVFTGLSVTGVAFQYGRGRARSMPTLVYAAKVSRNVRLLVYCDKLNQTSISAFLPWAALQKRVTNNLSQSILSQEHSPQPPTGEKKNHLVEQSQCQHWPIHVIGKNASGVRGGSMFYPWLQFKIIYLWLKCKLSNPHGLAACPAASVHVLEQGGRKFACSSCI